MQLTKALPLLLLLAPLAASCLADVEDDEPLGDAEERGISGAGPISDAIAGGKSPATLARERLQAWLSTHQGACKAACFDAWGHTCPEAEVCETADEPDDYPITCDGNDLTCGDARDTRRGDVIGLDMCWRGCEGLR